jgi:hypothetical protein
MSLASLAALTLAGIALATSGCGASAKSGEPSKTARDVSNPVTLTRAEIIEKADDICERANKARSLMPSINTPKDYGTILPRVAASEKAAIAELEKLTPPPSMATDWKYILTAARTLATETNTFGYYMSSGNPRAARLLMKKGARIQKPMVATAKRDGFVECSKFAV